MTRAIVAFTSSLIAGASIVSASWAADPPRMPHVSLLAFNGMGCPNQAVEDGLRELHYVVGQNIKLDCRHAHGQYADLDAVAAELVRSKPNVIVTIGHAQAQAARRATHEIPIVMLASGEPVAAGLVTSFAHPGGNVTGLSYFSTELNIKRLEFLKAIVPGLKRVGVLIDPAAPTDLNEFYVRDARIAGQTLGFEIMVFQMSAVADLDQVFKRMASKKVGAVFVPPKLRHPGEIERFVDLETHFRLPTMHYVKTFPEIGGLMSYGADYALLQRRAAIYVDKILHGARPADLPVEQPTQFILAINVKTARELGLTVPKSLLARADKVIE